MRQHTLGYFSSYDRGLHHLLKMWPKIKEKFPDAKLHVCYGWELFVKGYQNNPERMAWKERIDNLMNTDCITHHGRVSKEELNKITSECGIWTYPTDFEETNCITALNCQKLGCVPCVINKAALSETVGSGIKVDGDIFDMDVREEYLNKLFELMSNKELWESEQKKGILFAQEYTWENIATLWEKNFA